VFVAKPRVAAVVLAAGASTRMGTQKLLLPLDDEPLVRRTVRQVCEAGFDEVLVVVGHEHDKVLAALDGLPIRHAVNKEYAAGMGSSFRTAIEYLTEVDERCNQDPERKRRQRAGVGPREKVRNDAAMFALADQPFVSADEYRFLLNAYLEDCAKRPAIVTARYKNLATGPPHLFARALFPELAVLEHGARPVLERHAGQMLTVKLPNDCLIDIDTPDDYERVKNFLKKR